MTRLLIPALFVLIGIFCGLAVHQWRQSGKGAALPFVFAGILGAFGGLLLRDYLDLYWINNSIDTLLAVTVGALALPFGLSVIKRPRA